ncbi:MAG TPA: hypothetical protein VKY38_03685 [Azoarcus sp.]|nr:hypothetical protein [Azoarcus sp.]
MFIWLLAVTLAVSTAVCFIATRIFDRPVRSILTRLVSEELGFAWHRYITFAIYVVGISGGVRVWALERYVTPHAGGQEVVELNWARWVLEVYRSIIETLQGIAWMLLVFFIFALIAYVILRGFEIRQQIRQSRENPEK